MQSESLCNIMRPDFIKNPIQTTTESLDKRLPLRRRIDRAEGMIMNIHEYTGLNS